jgi:hypothetical protein
MDNFNGIERTAMTPQQANELLPCAFCGSAANLKEIGNDHTKTRAVQVKCSNMDCRVERTDKAMARGMEWLRAIAIENWNRRAPAPTEPAVDRDAGPDAETLIKWINAGAFGMESANNRRIMCDHVRRLATPASPAVPDRDHLLKIIAFAYQIAGAHDAPEHILDVLADPEGATAAQVDAMLPYQVGGGQAVPAERTQAQIDLAYAALSQVPLGHKLVPIEPTDAMDAAARAECHRMAGVIDPVIHIWDVMLAAAPQPSGNAGELPQVAQASQPTSAEGMTAWAAYCPAGFQFIHADQRVVEDFVYTRRYCGEGPYSIMHMKVSRPTSAEGKDSERLDWQPISAPGQVKAGDKLRFHIGDALYNETVKQVLDAGTDREELIYNKRLNYYVITKNAITNFGSSKNVTFQRASTGKDTDKEAMK